MNQPDSTTSRLTQQPQVVPAERPTTTLSAVPGKVQTEHLRRKAIVYVRQSSPQQVRNHRESRELQYAFVNDATALGWSKAQVEVIDEDQGQTAQTMATRPGFQRLLVEVSLDRVGIILGWEMSRLARSNKDWHQLLEICGIFRTLLADQDGVYDPSNFNDRLLLGLKGAMSEAELHILQGRLASGRLNKARRGELFNHPPIGYVKLPSGLLALDPDAQVQSTVRLIFDQFDRQGSLHGLLRYLTHHGVRIGIRPHTGPTRGELEWRRPNRMTLQNMLRHPIYAGFYRWGHRQTDPRRQIPGRRSTGRTVKKPQECAVLLPNRCPAYISAERFQVNQERLTANRARADAMGAARHGPSLLGGLLVCGRCGRRMMIGYTDNGRGLRYSCGRGVIDYGEAVCQGLAGRVLDELVTAQVLLALQPAELEISLTAVADIEQERARFHQVWQQQLERARYEAELTSRRYRQVDPDNRNVASVLEREWNEALTRRDQFKEEYEEFCRKQPRRLTEAELEQIRALARDVPALWQAATTTMADRQRMIRCVVEQVVVTVQGDTEQVEVTIHWQGGYTTAHQVVRPVRRFEQLSSYQTLLSRIGVLRAEGLSMKEVAERLNQEGFRPPKRSKTFNEGIVVRLLAKQDRQGPRPKAVTDQGGLQPGEWLLSDLARELQMPQPTVHRWIRVGWVNARKMDVPGGHWVIWADDEELTRLRRLRQHRRGWSDQPFPVELITPKARPNN